MPLLLAMEIPLLDDLLRSLSLSLFATLPVLRDVKSIDLSSVSG